MTTRNRHGITPRVLVKPYARVVTQESMEKFVPLMDGHCMHRTILVVSMENVSAATLLLGMFSTFNMKNGSLWQLVLTVVTILQEQLKLLNTENFLIERLVSLNQNDGRKPH